MQNIRTTVRAERDIVLTFFVRINLKARWRSVEDEKILFTIEQITSNLCVASDNCHTQRPFHTNRADGMRAHEVLDDT